MTRRISVGQARATFSELIGSVLYTREAVIVERHGRPAAVIISPEQYERWQQDTLDRFRETRAEVQRLNADVDPATVLNDVTAAVQEVRRRQRERERSGA